MTNYQRVFGAISDSVDDLVYDIQMVKYSYMLRTARGQHLDKIGDLVKYDRPFGLNDAQYRDLLLRAMMLNTGAGTLSSIRSFLEGYLGTRNINIYEPQVGTVTVALNNSFQPREQEIRDELRQLVACGIRIDIIFGKTSWNVSYWDDSDENSDTYAAWV